MMQLRLNATTFVISCSFSKSYDGGPDLRPTKEGKAREARLQMATLSGAEYSMISVWRFFWLDLTAPHYH